MRDEWDLIGVQPRGLAHAGPLHCEPFPVDPVTIATNGGAAHRAGCEAASGDDWRHLTTENTARDWELVRQALAEERISIHGLSYGTLLGSTYATLFPQHTDKVALDSGVHPDWVWNEMMLAQSVPYKQRVHAMFDWIAANDAVYGLGDTPLKVYQRWTQQVLAETGTTATLAPPPPPLPPLLPLLPLRRTLTTLAGAAVLPRPDARTQHHSTTPPPRSRTCSRR